MTCALCTKFTSKKKGYGGLCYGHAKAYYDYAEMKYWEMLDEIEEEKEVNDE